VDAHEDEVVLKRKEKAPETEKLNTVT